MGEAVEYVNTDEDDEYVYVDDDYDEYMEFDAPLGRVRAFAIKAHGNQKDKNGLPYVTHLDAVAANTVRLFGYDPDLLTVAYLHDVVEDTKYHQDDIDVSFPAHIADAVHAISKPSGEANYTYIGVVCEDEIAAKVKLADLLHNTSPDRLSALPDYTQQRLRKKYYPAIYRLCTALGIEPWISRDEAITAIRDSVFKAKPREIAVASLLKNDQIKFHPEGDTFTVEKVSAAISGPGFTQRDVSMSTGDTLRLKSSLMVTLLPRATSEIALNKDIAKYLGEGE